MEVLFATNNPAKIKIYADKLEQNGIELKTLLDLKVPDDVEENGKNSIENAIIKAKWVYGMAIYDGKDVQTFTWSKGDFYFVGKPSPILNEGYPLDSISVLSDTGKYFVDLTREEKDEYKNKNAKDDDVIKFILSSLNLE